MPSDSTAGDLLPDDPLDLRDRPGTAGPGGASLAGRRGTDAGRPPSGRACRLRALGGYRTATGTGRRGAAGPGSPATKPASSRTGAERRDRDVVAVDLADDELADAAVADQARPATRAAATATSGVVGGRAASGASSRRVRGRAPPARRRARRTRRRPAGAAGDRSRHGAATAARRRTGWPDPRRPAAWTAPVGRADPPAREPRAADRAHRPARTGPPRGRRRSSRAGSGPASSIARRTG